MSEQGIQAGRAIRRWHNDHTKSGEVVSDCPHCNPATHWMTQHELGDIWKDRISWVVQLPHGVMRTKTKRLAEAHRATLTNQVLDALENRESDLRVDPEVVAEAGRMLSAQPLFRSDFVDPFATDNQLDFSTFTVSPELATEFLIDAEHDFECSCEKCQWEWSQRIEGSKCAWPIPSNDGLPF